MITNDYAMKAYQNQAGLFSISPRSGIPQNKIVLALGGLGMFHTLYSIDDESLIYNSLDARSTPYRGSSGLPQVHTFLCRTVNHTTD